MLSTGNTHTCLSQRVTCDPLYHDPKGDSPLSLHAEEEEEEEEEEEDEEAEEEEEEQDHRLLMRLES